MVMTLDAPPAYEIQIQDIEYQHRSDKPLMATMYLPKGAGPFPAVVDIHGGAWNSKDRFDNDFSDKLFAERGIVVMAIEFRMPPEAPYPASLQDINFAVRWLKAHAAEYHSSAERVGAYGTSSGGHQALLTALRPADPRYRAISDPSVPDSIDASLAYVVSGWGVLDPPERYRLGKAANNASIVKSHDAFWGSEAAMVEGSPPAILERGEKVATPPIFLYQGTDDEWTTPKIAQHFAELYRKAGGTIEVALFPGEKHTFVREFQDHATSKKAIEMTIAFIKEHGSAKPAPSP